MQSSGWFGVRCIFRVDDAGSAGNSTYEERVTVWRAPSQEAAIGMAEVEAGEYAEMIDAEYLGLAQVYEMADELGDGAEVFSLARKSRLRPPQYLEAFFDTGDEHQSNVDPNTA